jgi:hypothetical protein
MASKSMTRPAIFWAPTLHTARKIDDSDVVASVESARYRFTASMADLERNYDEQASKLRAAFVAEVAAGQRGGMTLFRPASAPAHEAPGPALRLRG